MAGIQQRSIAEINAECLFSCSHSHVSSNGSNYRCHISVQFPRLKIKLLSLPFFVIKCEEKEIEMLYLLHVVNIAPKPVLNTSPTV